MMSPGTASGMRFQYLFSRATSSSLGLAKRLKELERENTELKKMLAEALLAKRVLEYVVEKKL